jgi:predicted RNA-binding Zn-ribbon protein involved in translation (DUF1610 family)
MTAADRFTYGKAASRTTVTASPNPAAYGTAVTFTVSVTAGAMGSVTVSTAGRTLCTTYPLFGGTASCSATTAPIGTDTITASYGGDAAYDGSAATATLTVRDVTKPSTKVTAPTAAFQLSKSVKATWTASDADSPSGIRYTVQYRRAAWNGGFGSYTQVLTKSTATSYTLTGTPGYDYCFRVQAVDASGNVSAWTPDRCTALPVDDRVLKATTSGWVRASDPAAYLGTVSTTATTGAKLTLSGVVADRLGLVVTECPTCGSIAIYRGATLWRTISTHATTTVHHVLIQLGTFSLGTVAVTIKRLTGSVRVDGLAVSRT